MLTLSISFPESINSTLSTESCPMINTAQEHTLFAIKLRLSHEKTTLVITSKLLGSNDGLEARNALSAERLSSKHALKKDS